MLPSYNPCTHGRIYLPLPARWLSLTFGPSRSCLNSFSGVAWCLQYNAAGQQGSQWRKALSLLNEAKEAGVGVDPATHDAVITALGKVCAVTPALLRSKGAEATGASVFFLPT